MEPNANVAVPPATIFSGDGLKVMFGVASTVPLVGGTDVDVGASVEPPPQAARITKPIREVVQKIVTREKEYACPILVNAGRGEAVIA
jgi:hypothetical protein